ncbi:DUF397 domain-containing protein [Streptomyces sp. NPDC001553]|uniref:DUF397 domain-containing protein n=1 Tax=unclassified Streptomyces TaxID=2593676 RepID=UPI0022572B5D|nr:DUF397 domain-containing protein [Streptomyces sp. NBC_00291]MCX5153538.1 DUF397 domain-containing protein [Streptomyces sp. NBC_00291]
MSTELTWFKSSYSGSEGGACLEVAVAWRKSSHSGDEGGQCVEVATCSCAAGQVHVRDSKVAHGPTLSLAPHSWTRLTDWVRD